MTQRELEPLVAPGSEWAHPMEHVFLGASVLVAFQIFLPPTPLSQCFFVILSPVPSCHVFVPTSSYSIWGSRENADKLDGERGQESTAERAPLLGHQAPCPML